MSVFQVQDIVEQIASYAPSLTAICNFALINKVCHLAAMTETRARIREVVAVRFMPEALFWEFLTLLGQLDSVVTGYVICAMWSDAGVSCEMERVESSVKVLCPVGSGSIWQNFFIAHGFVKVVGVEQRMESHVASMVTLKAEGCEGQIIIQESKTRSALTVLLAYSSTSDRRGINSNYVFDLHSAMTIAGGKISERSKLCDIQCVGEWATMNPKVHRAITKAGGENDTVVYKSSPRFFRYRIGEEKEGDVLGFPEHSLAHFWTVNGKCRSRGCYWFSRRFYPIRSSFVVETIEDVTWLSKCLGSMQTPRGILYGVQTQGPIIVPLPTITQRPVASQYMEIRYDIWFNCPTYPKVANKEGKEYIPVWKGNILAVFIDDDDDIMEITEWHVKRASSINVATSALYSNQNCPSPMSEIHTNELYCEVVDVYAADPARHKMAAGVSAVLLVSSAQEERARAHFDMLIGRAVRVSIVDDLRSFGSAYIAGSWYPALEFLVPEITEFDWTPEVENEVKKVERHEPSSKFHHSLYSHHNRVSKAITTEAQVVIRYHESYDSEKIRFYVVDYIKVIRNGINWFTMSRIPRLLEVPAYPKIIELSELAIQREVVFSEEEARAKKGKQQEARGKEKEDDATTLIGEDPSNFGKWSPAGTKVTVVGANSQKPVMTMTIPFAPPGMHSNTAAVGDSSSNGTMEMTPNAMSGSQDGSSVNERMDSFPAQFNENDHTSHNAYVDRKSEGTVQENRPVRSGNIGISNGKDRYNQESDTNLFTGHFFVGGQDISTMGGTRYHSIDPTTSMEGDPRLRAISSYSSTSVFPASLNLENEPGRYGAMTDIDKERYGMAGTGLQAGAALMQPTQTGDRKTGRGIVGLAEGKTMTAGNSSETNERSGKRKRPVFIYYDPASSSQTKRPRQ
ncbi:hypothetical protein K435DRAFT_864594 [Dendrothele bispora CBS 962.96]|uniref:Uncharacterized protein n=1 Tax=Dendrothele bispora (strain CBS 962.96) TaxID=1314807 RepID=A0A4V4HE83_DENBC|nr:hypothetical protein K435DRAFT_864594 [Dendrothele bispora CBS 962.96]